MNSQRREPRHVSVIIPVYNSASTLERAVASVLRQSLSDIELLIVDDGSTDGSLALAERLALEDDRITVIALPVNRGKSHAMNIAMKQAHGTWIAVLDADDWYEPDRLAALVSTGEAHSVQMVADNQYFHDAAANAVVGTAFPSEQGLQQLTRQRFIDGSNPYAAFDYGMLKPIVRADFVRRNGLAYRENARLSEDFLYLAEFFAAGGTALLLPQPLYNWTQSFGSVSRQWTTTGAGSWRYDFQSALSANAEVRERLHDKGEHALVRLLDTRSRAFTRLHHLNEISRLRAGGASIAALLLRVIYHPSVWPQLVRRVLRTFGLRPRSNSVHTNAT